MAFLIGAPSNEHHVEVVLDRAAHDAWAAARVTEVSRQNLAELRRAAFEAGRAARWQLVPSKG